jgi:hypothetical protein
MIRYLPAVARWSVTADNYGKPLRGQAHLRRLSAWPPPER